MTSETNQPTDGHAQPELKQVLGALLFAARKPIAAGELRAILAQVVQNGKDAAYSFGKIQESDIRTALEQLKTEIAERNLGIILVEVAGGFRFHTDPAGGPWVRQLLNLDKPTHLSKPALETLAIIAYRQPTTRAEIEALRGVNVDAMMRHLLELQLIRMIGRSDLPGRPLMYGTTQLFLEHFGLSSVKNLPGVEQLSRRDAERVKKETDDRRQMANDGGKAEKQTSNIQHPTSNVELRTEDDVQPGEALAKTEALAKKEAATEVKGAKAGQQTAEDSSANVTNTDKEEAAGKDKDKAEKSEEEAAEEDENEDDDEDEDTNDDDKTP